MCSNITFPMGKYDNEIQTLFYTIQEHIIKSAPSQIQQRLWANLPSFYVKKNFVRVIPFQDHVNIEAAAIREHQSELADYKITPKGMLQIYLHQPVPVRILDAIFYETLMQEKQVD